MGWGGDHEESKRMSRLEKLAGVSGVEKLAGVSGVSR